MRYYKAHQFKGDFENTGWLAKQEPTQMSKLRKSARDEECTLNIAGVCCYDNATTVLAHVYWGNKGKNCKDDISAVFSCATCHDALDGRVGVNDMLNDGEKYFYIGRALVRTHKRMIDKGLFVPAKPTGLEKFSKDCR